VDDYTYNIIGGEFSAAAYMGWPPRVAKLTIYDNTGALLDSNTIAMGQSNLPYNNYGLVTYNANFLYMPQRRPGLLYYVIDGTPVTLRPPHLPTALQVIC